MQAFYNWKRRSLDVENRTQNTILEDVELKSGDLVMVRFDAANCDSAKFPAVEQLDLRRHSSNNYLSFGHGVHFGVDAILGHAEMKISVRDC